MPQPDAIGNIESPHAAKPKEPTALPLPASLRRFWIATTAIFALTYITAQIRYWMGLRYNPFTQYPFSDLYEYIATFHYVHTAAFFHPPDAPAVAYPPFGAVLYRLCYLTPHPLAFYILVAGTWLAAGVWMLRRAMMQRGISTMTATLFPLSIAALSFPIPALLERGNIELFLWIFASLGVVAFVRGRNNLAAVLWALAAATKLYPVLFFALFLARRKYGAFALAIAAFIAASWLAMFWLGPSVSLAFHGSLHNIFGFQGTRGNEFNLHELSANHSLFQYAKILAIILGIDSGRLTPYYYALFAVIFAVMFFRKIVHRPVENQVLAITSFMIMLPPVAYFYSIVELFPAFSLLVLAALDAERAHLKLKGFEGTLRLFLPLFASFVFLTYPTIFVYGGLIQGALLLVLFARSTEGPLGVAPAITT
ncbi:Protein of unknown function [Bryocella elongata]|uniref:DUF2029 domain-containing protein n=1 Tax=Bryocella elongata TaxID=863522 RepID=A0A1H5WMA9_9BACT|nr:glycosyltransferase family 87 protein [Bryocella elongata]SEG00400.1 Protein of unknown function [Bryocella elongata]